MNDCLFITYCSKKKLDYSNCGAQLLLPSDLYISSRVQTFICFCKKHKYTWAIFSDYYGLVFENDKISWYDKSPNLVTDKEYYELLENTINQLKNHNKIFFYYNSETFHLLYRRLVNDLKKHKYVILLDRLEVCGEERNE